MRTLIAVPAMDTVPSRFAQSLAMLRKVGDCALTFQIGSLIYTSRNELSRKAIEMDADYIMWFDSDMSFDPDILERMFAIMKEKDIDILSGLYFRRVPPFSPVIFDKLEITDKGADWSEFEEIPDGLFEVGGCGFGCVLMKSDVIFDVGMKFGDLFSPIGSVGEDLSFCWRARQAGHKIYCDPSIELGHCGWNMVDRKFYNSFRNAQRKD